MARGERHSYFRLLLARAYAAQKNYPRAFTLLDEAWDLSTRKGGSGDSRVLLSRASFLFAQYMDQSDGSQDAVAAFAKVKSYVQDAMKSPAVRASFRPAFRNFLVEILWREGDLEEAYAQALRGTHENKYQERNFACLAAACLGTGRWEKATVAALRAMTLARQVVVWSLWGELFALLGGTFLVGATQENQDKIEIWIARLGEYSEFNPHKFDWCVPRKRVETSAQNLPPTARGLVSKALKALDAHPN